MAVLTDNERATLTAAFQSDMSSRRTLIAGLTKAQLRAAIDSADLWWENNRAALNTAIPLPARTALTAKQKVYLFLKVIERREAVEA